jgi:hypothetical protein
LGVWDNLCQVLKGLLVFDNEDALVGFWPDEVVLEHAKRDWLTAQKIFEEASHPELIDYAIYNLKAAEKRYMYLLKQLRVDTYEPEGNTSCQEANSA